MLKTIHSCAIVSLFTAQLYAGGTLSCADPDGKCESASQRPVLSFDNSDIKIPAFPYKPIIGTRNNDAKTVVDMGVALKVYVATYKDSKKTLVAAHDRYIWVKEPSFIVGLEKPDVRKNTGMMTAAGKVPFIFGAGEIDHPSIETNAKIKDYLDNVAEADRRDSKGFENMTTADDKFDSVIKNYLDDVKDKR